MCFIINAHFALQVREHLDVKSPERWIGCGGHTSRHQFSDQTPQKLCYSIDKSIKLFRLMAVFSRMY